MFRVVICIVIGPRCFFCKGVELLCKYEYQPNSSAVDAMETNVK
jgi:hypothetical protein